ALCVLCVERFALNTDDKIRCDACPVLCMINEGRTGACDRYANVGGTLTRVDPLVLLRKLEGQAGEVTGLLQRPNWDGEVLAQGPVFVSGVGSGTTYPDY